MILKWFKDLDPSKQFWQHAVHWGGVIVQLLQLRDNPTSSSIAKTANCTLIQTICSLIHTSSESNRLYVWGFQSFAHK